MRRLAGGTLGLGVLAVLALGGGAYAVADGGGTIHACANKRSGALRLAGRCTNTERDVSWNVQGPYGLQGPMGPAGSPGSPGTGGKDGVSVTSTALSAGDANCPNGGSSFTSANGTTFACNGASGTGTVRAYGRIDGTSVTQSQNIESVSNPKDGLFCITLAAGIDPSTTVPLVHPDANGDSSDIGDNAPLAWAEGSSSDTNGVGDCPTGTLLVLTGTRTENTTTVSGQTVVASVTNTLANQPFFIAVP